MVRDSIEPGQSALTSPLSVAQGVQIPGSPFRPLQMLMDTVITVEYGDQLQDSCSIHEGMISCHSEEVQSWCAQAKPLRAKYAKCDEVSQTLVDYSIQSLSEAKFNENGIEAKSAKLVGYIYNHFPLDNYGSSIVKLVDRTLVTQIAEKHVKNASNTPKTNTKAYHDLSLRGRLDLLDYEGMVNMIERVSSMLDRIKAQEKQKARHDATKAMAQKRIILHGVTESSVASLLAWVYQGEFNYETSEQLYELYDLAAMLRVDALAEKCLAQLSNTASDLVHQARQQGVLLSVLLGFSAANPLEDDRLPQDNTVEVIFHRVLKDAKSPVRLVNLVTEILAAGLDLDLWAQIGDAMSQPMTLRLVEAMLREKQVTDEALQDHDATVKLETSLEDHRAQAEPTNSQQQHALAS